MAATKNKNPVIPPKLPQFKGSSRRKLLHFQKFLSFYDYVDKGSKVYPYLRNQNNFIQVFL